MKRKLEMPEVINCAQNGCAYNTNLACHARAITVGGGTSEHLCDTMIMAADHTRREETAGVGACKSVNCTFNEDWECAAEGGININALAGQAECQTFRARD
jgi:hypothetical protein